MKIGILRERKKPADFRVALPPRWAAELKNQFPDIELQAEAYAERSFTELEYEAAGVSVLQDAILDADVYLGVKEIPVDALIPDKTYLFFSHTIKAQAHNRKLLQAVLAKHIRLIDYECLRNERNERLIGFGRYAGVVGAYNALRGWGLRTGDFTLKPAHTCFDRVEMEAELTKLTLGPVKILVTGGGRVGNGVLEILNKAAIRAVSLDAYLTQKFDEPVYCNVEFPSYNKRKDGGSFEVADFFKNPAAYESDFHKFLPETDLLIAGHYWAAGSPRFFSREDMCAPDFQVRVIADISCDIDGPIPSTLRASTIAEPFYGYNPETGSETEAFAADGITVMAVDNLPCELPRDASMDFGSTLATDILPLLITDPEHPILQRATIAQDGKLTSHYAYLQAYVDGQ